MPPVTVMGADPIYRLTQLYWKKMKTLINEKPQKLLDEATSASAPQEPRNRKQMYYVRRDRKRNLPETGTELGHLMFQVKDKDCPQIHVFWI